MLVAGPVRRIASIDTQVRTPAVRGAPLPPPTPADRPDPPGGYPPPPPSAGRPTGDPFLTFFDIFQNFRKLGVPPFFQECPYPDMTPTSLVLLISRSGIKLCLVLLVLTTDTTPPRQTPYTTFVSYTFSLLLSNFLEKV